MSVSGGGIAGGSDVNVELAMGGGSGFTKRLAELNAAQAAYEKALADLNLGKSAVAAHTEAGRVLSAALDKTAADEAAFDAEMKKVRDTVNDWAEKTKADTLAALKEAQSSLSEAQIKKEAASAAAMAAKSANSDAQIEASVILKDAQAAAAALIAEGKAKADKLVLVAEAASQRAKEAEAKTLATKDKYEKALEGFKRSIVAE